MKWGWAILEVSASSQADDLGAGVWHKRKITAAETPEAEGVSTREWEDQLGKVIASLS